MGESCHYKNFKGKSKMRHDQELYKVMLHCWIYNQQGKPHMSEMSI